MKVVLHNRGKEFIKTGIFYALFLFQGLNVFAQIKGTDTDTFTNHISMDTAYQPSELIYLQASKGIYETGEDLWFKAYILDAQYLVPLGLSKTLYLQLVNERTRQIYWQEKYEIQNRFADGHVYLQDTLPEGNYLLEAFTPHSFFNDSSEFESSRRIVVKKDMKPHVSVKAEFSQPSFSSGDTIRINILAFSEQSKPLYAEITAELVMEDKILETIQVITNEEGKAIIIFQRKNTGPDLNVLLKAKHTDAVENIELSVPYCEGSPIQFSLFPEGGCLVSGLENTLAFKALNIRGEPVEVEGALFENGDSLLTFKNFHAGMGSFNFFPGKNKKYHIQLSNPVSDSLWQLPEIKEEGVVFHLAKRDSDFLYFNIKQKSGAEQKLISLRGQLRGNVYCFKSGVLEEELEVKVAENVFPQQGIAEFTLLDGNLLPVAERLVYVNPESKLYIKACLSKEKYSIREKVILNLKVTDEYNQPVVAHLGISVFDKNYRNWQDAKNIFTHCFLTTQLKGRIYDPVYYFDEKNENRAKALDILLLTQGWRRYVWNEQLKKKEPENRQQVIYDGVKGTIKATKKLKNAPKGYQMLAAYNPSINDNKYRVIADSSGTFEVSSAYLKLGQGGHVYLTPMDKSFNYKLTIFSPFKTINNILTSKDIIYPKQDKVEESESQTRFFITGLNVIELEEVTVIAEKKHQFRDKYLGNLDSLAKLEINSDYVGECGLLNCPLCRTGKKPIEGNTYSKWVGTGMPEIISGIPGIHPFRFYTNEVIQIVYHYPEFTEEELLKLNNLTREKGYYPEREFYQPNYDATDSLDMVPDYRNTLLWAPNVLTDRNGVVELEFFCSDIYTDFVGVIEGVSGDGKLGHETFEFKVLKTGPLNWE